MSVVGRVEVGGLMFSELGLALPPELASQVTTWV
jgi:hypothetical protein